jgi:hypothetical protein
MKRVVKRVAAILIGASLAAAIWALWYYRPTVEYVYFGK